MRFRGLTGRVHHHIHAASCSSPGFHAKTAITETGSLSSLRARFVCRGWVILALFNVCSMRVSLELHPPDEITPLYSLGTVQSIKIREAPSTCAKIQARCPDGNYDPASRVQQPPHMEGFDLEFHIRYLSPVRNRSGSLCLSLFFFALPLVSRRGWKGICFLSAPTLLATNQHPRTSVTK